MRSYDPFILDVKKIAHAFLEIEVRSVILFCLFQLFAIPIAVEALLRLLLLVRQDSIKVHVLPCISFNYPGLSCAIEGTLVVDLVAKHC